jgi:hypothetical protein
MNAECGINYSCVFDICFEIKHISASDHKNLLVLKLA